MIVPKEVHAVDVSFQNELIVKCSVVPLTRLLSTVPCKVLAVVLVLMLKFALTALDQAVLNWFVLASKTIAELLPLDILYPTSVNCAEYVVLLGSTDILLSFATVVLKLPEIVNSYNPSCVAICSGTLVADEDCGGFEFECSGKVFNNGYDVSIKPQTTIFFASSSARININGGEFKSGLYDFPTTQVKLIAADVNLRVFN